MRRIWILLVAVLVIGIGAAQHASLAQAPDADRMVIYENATTIWRWTEAEGFVEVATLPERESMSLSPALDYGVYAVLTEQATADSAGGWGGGALPTNLWLLNVLTGETTEIAGQPGGASRPEIVRSDPVWSPDGTRIAWTEGADESALVIYDVAAGTSAVVREGIPSQTMVGTPADLHGWWQTGILVERVTFDDRFTPHDGGLAFYGVDGALISELPPVPTIRAGIDRYKIVLTPEGEERFLFMGEGGAWRTMDPLTGEIEPAPGGVLARVMPNALETSLRIDPAIVPDGSGDLMYEVYGPDGALVTTLAGDYPVLSASGRQIIYARSGGYVLHIWRADAEGGPYTLTLPFVPWAVEWGHTREVLERSADPLIFGTRCEGGDLSFRIDRDDTTSVLGNSPNNVRSAPGVNARVIGQIPGGAALQVTAGPACVDGIAWWAVTYGDLEGWTAEGAEGEYFLAPGSGEGLG